MRLSLPGAGGYFLPVNRGFGAPGVDGFKVGDVDAFFFLSFRTCKSAVKVSCSRVLQSVPPVVGYTLMGFILLFNSFDSQTVARARQMASRKIFKR